MNSAKKLRQADYKKRKRLVESFCSEQGKFENKAGIFFSNHVNFLTAGEPRAKKLKIDNLVGNSSPSIKKCVEQSSSALDLSQESTRPNALSHFPSCPNEESVLETKGIDHTESNEPLLDGHHKDSVQGDNEGFLNE